MSYFELPSPFTEPEISLSPFTALPISGPQEILIAEALLSGAAKIDIEDLPPEQAGVIAGALLTALESNQTSERWVLTGDIIADIIILYGGGAAALAYQWAAMRPNEWDALPSNKTLKVMLSLIAL